MRWKRLACLDLTVKGRNCSPFPYCFVTSVRLPTFNSANNRLAWIGDEKSSRDYSRRRISSRIGSCSEKTTRGLILETKLPCTTTSSDQCGFHTPVAPSTVLTPHAWLRCLQGLQTMLTIVGATGLFGATYTMKGTRRTMLMSCWRTWR